MRILPLENGGLLQRILADGATALSLPYPPQVAQLPMGYSIEVADNTGAFSGANMTVTGPINSTTVSTTATLSTASSRTSFEWVGDRYLQK